MEHGYRVSWESDRDKRPSVVVCAERAREDRGGAARTAGGWVERAIEATLAQKLFGCLCRAFLGKTGLPESSVAGRAYGRWPAIDPGRPLTTGRRATMRTMAKAQTNESPEQQREDREAQPRAAGRTLGSRDRKDPRGKGGGLQARHHGSRASRPASRGTCTAPGRPR